MKSTKFSQNNIYTCTYMLVCTKICGYCQVLSAFNTVAKGKTSKPILSSECSFSYKESSDRYFVMPCLLSDWKTHYILGPLLYYICEGLVVHACTYNIKDHLVGTSIIPYYVNLYISHRYIPILLVFSSANER